MTEERHRARYDHADALRDERRHAQLEREDVEEDDVPDQAGRTHEPEHGELRADKALEQQCGPGHPHEPTRPRPLGTCGSRPIVVVKRVEEVEPYTRRPYASRSLL